MEMRESSTRCDRSNTTGAEHQVWLSRKVEDPNWDAFLALTPGGHHLQTSLWAQVKAAVGWRAARVIVTGSDGIVAGGQMLIRPLPLVGSVGYMPRGPVVISDDPKIERILMHQLHRMARAHRVQYMVVQPPLGGEPLACRLPEWGFRPSRVSAVPTATVLIDLSKGLDDLLARMKEQTRKNIRRGLHRGIVVREGTESDLHTVYRLVVATSERQKGPVYPEAHIRELWRVFHPRGYLKLFVAEHEGEVVSIQIVIPFKDTVSFKTFGWSGKHANFKPNDVLLYKAFEWAASAGYRYCDLEGIEMTAANALLCGQRLPEEIRQTPTYFKLGFGGQVTLFPGSYDYVSNPALRWSYNTFYPFVATSPIMSKVMNSIRGVG